MLSASASAVDLNGDGALDNADLDVMRASFYKHDGRADLNGDGIVNFADLAILKGAMTGASAAPLVSPSVYLLPADTGAPPNGTLTLDLWMDFSADPTLGGGTDIHFTQGRMTFVSFVFDPNLGDDPAFRRVPNLESPGELNALAFGSFDGLTGPARVGTFTFNTKSVLGATTISMSADDFLAGPFISLATLLPQNVTFIGSNITIQGANISAPATVDLGNVRQGQTESKQVTVTNTGFAVLNIGQLGNTDPLAAPFSLANNTCNGKHLQPNTSCTVAVRLQGSSQGVKNDSFNIPSNDADTPSLSVAVTGTVVQKVGVNPITKVTTTTAQCKNQTTGQTVQINLAGATSLNCETAGLSPLAPGNIVVIQINGTSQGGQNIGGTVKSMGLTQVTCQNLTSGQTRTFDPSPPGPTPRNWNCVGGGWSAPAGNNIRMTVTGPAD